MKKSELKNRFSNETRHEWLYWYECIVCGKNQQDVLHHIISPSVKHYVAGKHNQSVLNSCPIHNQVCHIGNESWLGKDENIAYLLKRTYEALRYDLGYQLKPIDEEFFKIYSKVYGILTPNGGRK